MTVYINRDIGGAVRKALRVMPVVVITGMRQTGKSTFLQNDPGVEKRKYITLDDFEVLEAARNNPMDLLNHDKLITVDEAQKCPGLLTVIKKIVDKTKQPGQFILSGSANFSLLKEMSESLAGRAIYFSLHPFTKRELENRTSSEPFLKRFFFEQHAETHAGILPVRDKDVINGGMPPILAQNKDRFLWFRGFEQTYLERDIKEYARISDVVSFRNLLRLAVFRSSQILSASQLGRDAKMTSAKISNYLSILETSFVLYRLQPYLKNRSSRLIKSPKIFAADSGLACYLAGVENISSDLLKGAMFETYVAQNLLGILDAAMPEAKLYFWNIQGRHEVDFVVESGRKCIAIEIKSGSKWDKSDLGNIRKFLSSEPDCIAGILAYNGDKAVKLDKYIWAIPIGLLLS